MRKMGVPMLRRLSFSRSIARSTTKFQTNHQAFCRLARCRVTGYAWLPGRINEK
jgi:hypothetical protein